jgi:hypothetical protein
VSGSTLAIAAAAALVLGAPVPAADTSGCPELRSGVEQRLPGLSSAVQVRVEPVPGGARVQVLDRSGRTLDDGEVRAGACATLADQAAERVRRWAAAHGAWREAGALPIPPLVDVPEAAAEPTSRPPATAAARASQPAGELPFRLGAGAGAGALVDAGGAVPGFEAWVLLGAPRQPYWGELSMMLTAAGRVMAVDRFVFTWSRSVVVAAGGAYRLSQAPVEVVAGLQGGRLELQPAGPVQAAPGFTALDGGGYAGLRAVLDLGGLSGWLGTRISVWFVQHRIEVILPASVSAGVVPLVGVWFGVGVQAGGQG